MQENALFEVLKLIFGGLALISVYVAHQAYEANLKKQEEDRIRDADKELLAQAQRSLEWAYDALTDKSTHIPPKPDRLNWLTAARHILRQGELAALLRSTTYKLVHAEIEEYWRHKFYLALDHNALCVRSYFMKNDASRWPEEIEISSALVIIDFSNWPKDKRDITDTVDRQVLMNDRNGLRGRPGRGLRSYIFLLEEIKGQPHDETDSQSPGE